nr:TetR/AcrR family transcriptional regulator [uncultured Desulfuromonas sp.]
MGRPNLKKEVIEDAAIRLFATKGLARTVIRDIAREAGVTEGALYKHYPSKDAMAWALFQREIDRFTAPFAELLAEEIPVAQRLVKAIHYTYEYYRQFPTRFTFILLMQHGFPEEDLETQTNPNDVIIRFIEELHGEKPGGAVLLAAMVMGAVMQPLVMHRYGRIPLISEEVITEVSRAVCRLLEVDDAL